MGEWGFSRCRGSAPVSLCCMEGAMGRPETYKKVEIQDGIRRGVLEGMLCLWKTAGRSGLEPGNGQGRGTGLPVTVFDCSTTTADSHLKGHEV